MGGIPHCYPDYTQFVENKRFILSTTQQYDPYENVIAERINGILKYEFGLKNTLKSVELTKEMTAKAVILYNNERRYCSLDFKKNQKVHLEYSKQPNKNYKKEKLGKIKFKNLTSCRLCDDGNEQCRDITRQCQNYNSDKNKYGIIPIKNCNLNFNLRQRSDLFLGIRKN